MKRVGILGGTFDPIHNGHLKLASCACEQFDLEEVRFIPAGNPPHKPDRTDGASDTDRLAMAKLAVRDDPRFSVDPIEMNRSGPSYTKDTMLYLHQHEPESELYFIIGADSLLSFDSWKEPAVICRTCSLLVAGRDALPEQVLLQKIDDLEKRYGASVFLLHFADIPISSRSLREWIRADRSIRSYVPDAVLDYIEKHAIYRS